MKKQITLVLVALFICNLGAFAQNDEGVPEITSIELAGRGVYTNGGFGHFGDFCAKESEGVFTWVGRLINNSGSGGQGFKCYVNAYTTDYTDDYQLTSPVNEQPFEDGGTYSARYLSKTVGAISGGRDYKWRTVSGEDGYYKIVFDVSDVTNVTLSPTKVDETYANLGSLSVTDFALVQKDDESKGFDPDVYEYNCYIPATAISIEVSHFAFRNTKVSFNTLSVPISTLVSGKAIGVPYTQSVTVSDGETSTIEVTGFDNATTKTYTINYKLDLLVKGNLPTKLQSSTSIEGLDEAKKTSVLPFNPDGDYTVEISSTVSDVTAAGRGMDFEVRSGSGMGFRTSLSDNSFKWAAPFSASSEISATEGGKQVVRYAVKDNQVYVYLNGNYVDVFDLASVGDMDGDGTTEVSIAFVKSGNVYAYADMYDGVNLITNPDFRDDAMNAAPTGWGPSGSLGGNVARVSGNNDQVTNYETTHKAFYIRYQGVSDAYYYYAVTLKPDTWYEYSYDLIAWTASQGDTGCNFDFIVSKVATGSSDNIFSQTHTSPTTLNTAERHVVRFKTPSSENPTDTYYLVYKQKTDKKNIGITDLYLEEKSIGSLLFGKNYTDGEATIQIDYIRVDYSGAFAPGIILVNAQIPEITVQPQDATVNKDDEATLTVTASVEDGGTLSYQWYQNDENSYEGGSPVEDANAPSYSPSTASVGISYYYVVVTNTNEVVYGETTAADTSAVATVTVIPLVDAQTPEITAQPQDATVYKDDEATLTVTASVEDGGTLSYQWYQNSTNSNEDGSPVGTDAPSYSPSTASVGISYYYVVVTNTNEDVNGETTASVTSNPATVTVDAQTDIEDANAGKAVKSVSYSDLLGRPVPENTQGVVICRTTYEDDSVKTDKVFNAYRK
jgi:quinol monooxygenase YgiN